jgi:Zn-dependent peptidase ImmA (M78 family)/DNA-binding Xre family transcriptional regulator
MFKEIGAVVAAERIRQKRRVADLGVDAHTVENLETGNPGITTSQLDKIAAALQLDPFALRAGTLQRHFLPSVFFRQIGMHQDLDSADGAALDVALEHARARNHLTAALGLDAGLFPTGRLTPHPVAADAPNAAAYQGYQFAQDLRRTLGNESSALSDLRELAEQTCGVAVLVRRLTTAGSTAVAVKSGNAAAIVLATTAASQRRELFARTWIAHELCHVFFDPDVGGVHLSIDVDDERQVQQPERRARAFAAELLLPLAGLRKLIGPPAQVGGESTARNLVAMARDAFGSTWQVAANHLCNHGFLSMDLRESLKQSPPAMTREWLTTLPDADAPSLQVAGLTRRAYDAGLLTDGEARSLLGLERLAPLPWERFRAVGRSTSAAFAP